MLAKKKAKTLEGEENKTWLFMFEHLRGKGDIYIPRWFPAFSAALITAVYTLHLATVTL